MIQRKFDVERPRRRQVQFFAFFLERAGVCECHVRVLTCWILQVSLFAETMSSVQGEKEASCVYAVRFCAECREGTGESHRLCSENKG